KIKVPLPPIHPTLNYSDQRSDYEFEHLVLHTISMQNNWHKDNPTVISRMTFDANLQLNMKLLPGGKYLIASIRDDSYHFFIALYYLDHPGPHALAKCQTQFEVYQLQAKYMKYKNKHVLMIAYMSWGKPAK
ncbi:hypothetical protein C0989_011540, partial [Termitomyces sp. Mn162]